MLALAAYGGVRRSHRVRVRPHAVALGALGLAVTGIVVGHAGRASGRAPRLAGASGSLLAAFALAAALGAFGAVVYRAFPARLARLEREGLLPEELGARQRELRERIFRGLTGRDELVKTIFRKFLAPYERAPWGPLALALSAGPSAGGRLARASTPCSAVVARTASTGSTRSCAPSSSTAPSARSAS